MDVFLADPLFVNRCQGLSLLDKYLGIVKDCHDGIPADLILSECFQQPAHFINISGGCLPNIQRSQLVKKCGLADFVGCHEIVSKH